MPRPRPRGGPPPQPRSTASGRRSPLGVLASKPPAPAPPGAKPPSGARRLVRGRRLPDDAEEEGPYSEDEADRVDQYIDGGRDAEVPSMTVRAHHPQDLHARRPVGRPGVLDEEVAAPAQRAHELRRRREARHAGQREAVAAALDLDGDRAR